MAASHMQRSFPFPHYMLASSSLKVYTLRELSVNQQVAFSTYNNLRFIIALLEEG